MTRTFENRVSVEDRDSASSQSEKAPFDHYHAHHHIVSHHQHLLQPNHHASLPPAPPQEYSQLEEPYRLQPGAYAHQQQLQLQAVPTPSFGSTPPSMQVSLRQTGYQQCCMHPQRQMCH